MIVSWAVDASWKPELTTVYLLVEPRDGFTHRLLGYAKRSSENAKHLVLYSGSHGSPTSMKEYGTVLLIATGFGIVAILPHLKELLDGYGRCEVITRRIHVVWQLNEEGMRIYLSRSRVLMEFLDDEYFAKDLIDNALDADNNKWVSLSKKLLIP